MIGGDPTVFLASTLWLIPAALIAIPVHELGHALAAYLQGDRSVRNRGYLGVSHLRSFFEPYGLLAVFLARTGWGRPAPINEYRLRGVPGRLAYALAGPLASLLVAAGFGVLARVLAFNGLLPFPGSFVMAAPDYLATIVYAIFFLNLSVFAFNLLPLPGLDGWRVVEALFRSRNPKFFFEADSRRREVWMVFALVIVVSSILPGVPNLLQLVLLPFYAPASFLILGACLGYPGLIPCLL